MSKRETQHPKRYSYKGIPKALLVGHKIFNKLSSLTLNNKDGRPQHLNGYGACHVQVFEH